MYRSVEEGGEVSVGESERERSLLVLLIASWPRTANEGVARWRARGRGKGDGWWNQTGAAATRRVSRSLCRAWKKRGEGRGSSKAAGKAGSSTYDWRATSAVGCLMALFDTMLSAIRRIRSPFLSFRREEVAVGKSGSKCWVGFMNTLRARARAYVCVYARVC